jgi:hypothetical protein
MQRKTASKVFTNNNFNSLMFGAFSKHAKVVGEVIDKHLEEGPVRVNFYVFLSFTDVLAKVTNQIVVTPKFARFLLFCCCFRIFRLCISNKF